MVVTTQKRSYVETGIALHLLPVVVAQQIRKIGDKIYRISVKRTHWHYYDVTIRTRLYCRELEPVKVAVIPIEPVARIGKRTHKGKPGSAS